MKIMSNNAAEEEVKMGELIEFDPKKITAFDKFKSEFAQLKADNSAIQFDYKTRDGDKAARSHIYSLRQAKSKLDKTRKAAKERAVIFSKKVDEQAGELKVEIEEMIEVHAKPIRELEEEAEKRTEELSQRVSRFSDYLNFDSDTLPEVWLEELENLTAIELEGFDEFTAQATAAKENALETITDRMEAKKKADDDAAELQRLKKEADEREEQDRLQKVADDAAAKVRVDAEQAAQKETERLAQKAEDLRLENERIANEATAEIERLKQVAIDVEKKAQQDEIDRQEKIRQDAIDAEAAAEKIKQDAIDKEKREQQEAADREADEKHRETVNAQAVEGLIGAGGITDEQAENIISAIADGTVPNVVINY